MRFSKNRLLVVLLFVISNSAYAALPAGVESLISGALETVAIALGLMIVVAVSIWGLKRVYGLFTEKSWEQQVEEGAYESGYDAGYDEVVEEHEEVIGKEFYEEGYQSGHLTALDDIQSGEISNDRTSR